MVETPDHEGQNDFCEVDTVVKITNQVVRAMN